MMLVQRITPSLSTHRLSRQAKAPRFGICPVCTTLGAAGLVAGAAGIKWVKTKLTPIVGEPLATEVASKLTTIDHKKKGFFDRFKGAKQIDSPELMAELGPDLVQKLTQRIEAYYKSRVRKP